MEEETTKKLETNSIRRQWDEETHKWYFSIVDIIDVTTLSTNPRNYWKVLKNRLKNSQKKGQNELVSKCNRLKLKASDDKYYLTDVADEATILEILRIVSPKHFFDLKVLLQNFGNPLPDDKEFHPLPTLSEDPLPETKEESYPHTDNDGLFLIIDAYAINNLIIVKAFTAGIGIKNISIHVTKNTLTITGDRSPSEQNQEKEKNYLYQELSWGKFYRSVKLPEEIDVHSTVATCDNGLLKIKFRKLNKSVKKIMDMKIKKT